MAFSCVYFYISKLDVRFLFHNWKRNFVTGIGRNYFDKRTVISKEWRFLSRFVKLNKFGIAPAYKAIHIQPIKCMHCSLKISNKPLETGDWNMWYTCLGEDILLNSVSVNARVLEKTFYQIPSVNFMKIHLLYLLTFN